MALFAPLLGAVSAPPLIRGLMVLLDCLDDLASCCTVLCAWSLDVGIVYVFLRSVSPAPSRAGIQCTLSICKLWFFVRHLPSDLCLSGEDLHGPPPCIIPYHLAWTPLLSLGVPSFVVVLRRYLLQCWSVVIHLAIHNWGHQLYGICWNPVNQHAQHWCPLSNSCPWGVQISLSNFYSYSSSVHMSDYFHAFNNSGRLALQRSR